MRVKEIMSREVARLTTDDSIEKAAQLMKQHNVGSIPICSPDDKLVGMVTDRDIALRAVADNQDVRRTRVKEIMSENPVVGNADMDVHDAAKVMSEKQIRRLPIVEDNCLVGIVSLGDISLEPVLQDNAEDALKAISEPTCRYRE